MRADELVTAIAGVLAAVSFVTDYLRGLIRRPPANGHRSPVNPLVIFSAIGIAILVMLLLASVLLDWPAWVIHDAMGILASLIFPFAQSRLHRLRRAEADRMRA